MMKVDQDQLQEGYVILPVKALEPEMAMTFTEQFPTQIISKREMMSMYTSTVMEINKGDNSQKSLNIKLYNCLAQYAQGELDAITKRTLT